MITSFANQQDTTNLIFELVDLRVAYENSIKIRIELCHTSDVRLEMML
jgi:hypothetical protein